MTKAEAILLLLRCLSHEPELCPAADRAIQNNPEMAQFVVEMQTLTGGLSVGQQRKIRR